MNKYLIAMIAMLTGPLLCMDVESLEVDTVTTTYYDAYPQEDKDHIQQIITQLPVHLQEDLAWTYTWDTRSGDGPLFKKDRNIELCFSQKIDGQDKFKGLAHVVNCKLHWIFPIDEAVKDSPDLKIGMTGLSVINKKGLVMRKTEHGETYHYAVIGQESFGMRVLDCIEKGLLVRRYTNLLKDMAIEQQKKLDEFGSKQELSRFTSNPNEFCGEPVETNVTLRVLEIAINEGKFKYPANQNAARDFIALKILNVKYAGPSDIENAYSSLVLAAPKTKRAYDKCVRKYNEARNYLLRRK